MKIKEVKKLSAFDRLVYWITERESIRLKKESGCKWPWTDDEVLSTYKFCNVRRADDRVSRWLITNWYEPYFDHPNMIVAATLARQLNNPASLEEVGFPEEWDADRIEGILNDRVTRGLTNFSPAYMITGTLGGTKVQQIVNKVVTPIHVNRPALNRKSMERSCEVLLPYAGFSTFIAGQVVSDLRWGMKGSWSDKMSWAPVGPGSRRGLNVVLGREFDAPMKQAEFSLHFQGLMEGLRNELPTWITDRMEAIDFQNCLCETYKYTKTLNGEGRPKQLYRGPS